MSDIDPAVEWRSVLDDDELVGRGECEPEDLADLESTPAEYLPESLGGVAYTAAGLVIADGPDAIEDELLRPLVALHDRARMDEFSVFSAMGILNMAGVLASTGHAAEPTEQAVELLPQLLDEQASLRDRDVTRLGLTAAALRISNYVPEFVGGSIEGPFVAGEEFGPDLQEFARYVVKAARAEADAAAIAPAWTSVVGYFPLRLQAGTVSWLDLLWAGYGVYTRVAGYPPGEVAQAIHDFVHEVAAA